MSDNLSHETYLFDGYKLDVTAERLLHGDEKISLPPKAFALLVHFARNSGRLIGYLELMQVGWPEVTDHETRDHYKASYPQQQIDLIRSRIGDSHPYHIITNQPKRGYRFEATVIRVGEGNSVGKLLVLDDSHDDVPNSTETVPSVQSESDAANAGSGVGKVVEPAFHAPSEKRIGGDNADSERLINEDARIDIAAGVSQPTDSGSGSLEDQDSGVKTFEDWIVGPGSRIGAVFGGLVLATVIASWIVANKSTPARAQTVACIAQCAIIIIALLHCLRIKPKTLLPKERCDKRLVIAAGYRSIDDYENDRPVLERARRQYTKNLAWLLGSWVPLYVVFAWAPHGNSATMNLLETLFNLLNTAMIVLCFNVLNRDVGARQNRRLSGQAVITLAAITITAVLTLFSSELLSPVMTQLQAGGAALLSGVGAGIVMALFVGRLQSKFLGPESWVVFLLYSYTAIQPLSLYIQNRHGWAIVILNYALLLKCLLYLYSVWLLRSGDFFFYLAQVKRTYEDVDDRRSAHRRLLA